MSDSFADLWSSSVPQKKQQPLSALARQHPPQPTQRGPDLFALLSSSPTPPTHTPTPPPQQPKQQPRKDAFEDLFSGSSTAQDKNLTIAQRAALADMRRQPSSSAQPDQDSSAWAGLDSLGGGFSGLTPTTVPSTNQNRGLVDDDDWGLSDFGTSTPPSSQHRSKPTPPVNDNDHWRLETLSSSQAEHSTPGMSSGPLWDLDDFSTTAGSQLPKSRVDSPSNDFDFGSREDSLLNRGHSREDADEDFMSVFNNPPQPKPTLPPRSSNQQPSTSTKRAGSPPPHILGQIVEMGFSIPQAKAALAANNNDVQAALEQLLTSEGRHASSAGSVPGTPPSASPPQSLQQPAIPRRRDREILRDRERRTDTSSPASTTGTGDIQAQAEQLLAQASEIGRGMFSKASLFLKEKKVQVQKAVEEHRSSSAASGASVGSGRPKWMQGPGDEESGEPTPRKGEFRDRVPSSGFRDDLGSGEPETEVRIPRRLDRQRERERAREQEFVPAPPVEEPEVDLFAPSEPTTRTHDPFQTTHSSSTPDLPGRSRQQPSSTRPHPQQPIPKFQRHTTPIPSSIASLKAEANSAFKLGQFGNAEALYTRAIDALGKVSSNSIYCVLLLNNRANARMKIGDVGGAVRDCECVVGLVITNQIKLSDEFDVLGGGASGSEELKIDWEPAYDGDGKLQIPISGGGTASEVVDLGDGMVKAIKRRAEAYEGMEKWGKAKKDWEWLRSTAWVRDGVRSEAGRGVGRCARMVGGDDTNGGLSGGMNGSSSPLSTSNPTQRPKPKLKPKVAPPSNTRPSGALQTLRTSNAQAEAEDQAKHELKDTVDTKISAWKSGKETNIRALLASLDLVLWEELLNSGGSSVKVGMHEVVTPAQVKVKYMKAVARVHPDKLNLNNSTLEQRMIAQGVFGSLNEAWNAFKQ